MSALLIRVRRRGAALAAALAVATLGLAGAGAAPASAGPGPIYTIPCYQYVCLSETAYNAGFTAKSAHDVSATPWYFSIWNMTTRARLALCGYGTSCVSGVTGYPGPNQCYDYIAYIGASSGILPPTPVQWVSNVIRICR